MSTPIGAAGSLRKSYETGPRKVLIAGGGVAALEAALALRSLAGDRVRIQLLAPELRFWYQPLAVAVPFGLGEVRHFELDGLARRLGAEFMPGGIVAVDAARHIAHTSNDTQIDYDSLLVACGVLRMPAIPGAVAFRGPADVEQIDTLLRDLASGAVRSVAFVIPWGASYSLPAYELALLTTMYLDERGISGRRIAVVTPEEEPLQVFGGPASEAIRELLAEQGVTLRTSAHARDVVDGALRLSPEGEIVADQVIALPRLIGPPIRGLPQTVLGFVQVDAHCRVRGIDDVYAAGDITSFTIKHGGLAAQQADAAAEAIAADAGVDIVPERFRPVLRGLLLTGRQPRYLRRELRLDPEAPPAASAEALWWPPAKIAGRHLAPFLASIEGVEPRPELPLDAVGAVPVERELDPDAIAAALHSSRPRLEDDDDSDRRVGDVMSRPAVFAAPEDTLGEIAEALLHADARVATVVAYGRLVGILAVSDIVRACAARAHPSEARARVWMTVEPVTVPVNASLGTARMLMDEYDIGQLPAVESERVVGMIHRDQVGDELLVSPGLGF